MIRSFKIHQFHLTLSYKYPARIGQSEQNELERGSRPAHNEPKIFCRKPGRQALAYLELARTSEPNQELEPGCVCGSWEETWDISYRKRQAMRWVTEPGWNCCLWPSGGEEHCQRTELGGFTRTASAAGSNHYTQCCLFQHRSAQRLQVRCPSDSSQHRNVRAVNQGTGDTTHLETQLSHVKYRTC